MTLMPGNMKDDQLGYCIISLSSLATVAFFKATSFVAKKLHLMDLNVKSMRYHKDVSYFLIFGINAAPFRCASWKRSHASFHRSLNLYSTMRASPITAGPEKWPRGF